MRYEIRSTKNFNTWFDKIKDTAVKHKVLARFARIENGNFGDYKQLDADLFELRFFFGSGLRIYYTIKNDKIVLLVTGGDKSSQNKDIVKARNILMKLED